jgi:glutamine amidotransferase
VPVAASVVHAPHSLLRQCTDAREQASGCTNLDGWGIGWWADDDDPAPYPYRYRSATAMPADHDGLEAIEGLDAGRFVAHTRLKSPGSPTEVTGNAPFVAGRWLFAHNGFVAGYREGVRDELFGRLSPGRQEAIEGDADSEVLFGLVLDAMAAGTDPAHALVEVIGPLARRGGRYNVVLTDGRRLLATRWDNSLYRRGDPTDGGAFELASEPYDGAADWQPVPDRTLVHLEADRLELAPL